MKARVVSELSQAFNQGCDARLAGKRERANPYAGQDLELARCWMNG